MAKAPANIRSLARKHTEEAINKLVYWMRQNENPGVSERACEELLDRGWGKATQAISGEDGAPIQVIIAGPDGGLL